MVSLKYSKREPSRRWFYLCRTPRWCTPWPLVIVILSSGADILTLRPVFLFSQLKVCALDSGFVPPKIGSWWVSSGEKKSVRLEFKSILGQTKGLDDLLQRRICFETRESPQIATKAAKLEQEWWRVFSDSFQLNFKRILVCVRFCCSFPGCTSKQLLIHIIASFHVEG